jgi:hypothetical protein
MDFSVIGLIVLGSVLVVLSIVFFGVIKKQQQNFAAQRNSFETEKKSLEQQYAKALANTLDPKDAEIKSLEEQFGDNTDSVAKKLKTVEAEKRQIESYVKEKDALCQTLQQKIVQLEKEKNSALNTDNATSLKEAQEKLSASNAELQEKLEKALKENKSLEDKIDDLEDDYDELDNKFKKQKKEMSSLKDDLEESQRAVKRKSDEKAELLEKLNGTEANLTNKKKALTFVQEILSAKENPDNTTKEHRKAINEINSFMNDSLFGLMRLSNPSEMTEDEIKKLKNEFEVWQNLEKKNWLKNKRTIAFVGEFSAGKTSIVNTILLQNDKNVATLPENSKATTAIPTYISNTSGRPSFAFLTPSNQLKTMSEATFKMVDKEVLENVKGTSSLIKYFVMSYNNKSLSDLSILDTPGFDSNDPEDAMRTIEVINECDALFWVIDVNKGELNKTSIKTIKENLHRPLFIVINKVDTKNPEGVETFKKKIKETLANSGISYEKIISFSKKEKASEILKYLNSVNKASVEVNAIESIRNIMKKYKRDIHSKVVKCKSLAESARGEGSNTSAQFTRSVNNLIKKCETVGDIPSWKKHLLSANVYEMSPTQHSDFEKGLDDIKNISKKTKELYEKRMDIEKDIVGRSKEFQDKVQLELKWDELISVFERHAQQFNMSKH